VIAQTRPELVRKIVLAGTGPAGGVGISNVGTKLYVLWRIAIRGQTRATPPFQPRMG
jgi:hypothetical protein